MPYKKISIVTIPLILSIIFFFYQRQKTSSPAPNQPPPTPTLDPQLARLTIPFLQQFSPDSPAYTIESTYQQKSTYNSYIASYQSEGNKIYGLLTIPTNPKPEAGYPAIVFLHGYIPPNQYQTTQKYADYVDYLARNGFVVFKIDYRGHGDSQGNPNGAYYSSDYIIDTLNAVYSLQQSSEVNPQAIGLWGHSMSGNVVLRTLVAKPQTFKAVVIWAGAVYTYKDMQEFGIQDNSFRREDVGTEQIIRQSTSVRQILGSFDENNPLWQQIVPTNYANSNTPPIEIHHAQNDSVVNPQYTQNLDTILTQHHVTHQTFYYPSGGHNLDNPAFNLAMQRTVDFFNTYLK